jgi:hypothetical protein
MATSRLVLNTKELTDDFFDETRLLGIMAPIKDYHFAWHLNLLMIMDFRSNADLEIKLIRKKRTYFFPVYSYFENNSSLCHYIYKNHMDGEYLLPEFRHLDFLWLMKGDTVSDDAVDQLMAGTRLISGVQLVLELSSEKIVNKENLVF